MDASSNVVLCGNFQNSVDFGGGSLTSAGIYDAFLAKYNSSGVHQWSRRFGSTANDIAFALTTDASANAIVTGYFTGTVDFGAGALTVAGGVDVFGAKYDPSGTCQWSQRFGKTNNDYGNSVATDASGNVFVTGYVSGTVDFGGGGGGQPLFYLGAGGATPLPPDEVLDYMGVTPATFGITDDSGLAIIPFLTDLISGGQAPNSLFVGSFDITGTKLTYSSTQAYSFPAYPAMSATDRSFDFTVSIEGLSAESPDPSRWLVVPPDLEITDMTYYHSGDVIVAAGGTLSIIDTTFSFVQDYSNQRSVVVDSTEASPAKLLFVNSDVQSAMPINIIVKGYATLEANFTNFIGVNIVALEHSRVILRNVTMMGGSLTTRKSANCIEICFSPRKVEARRE